jgi:hypothetical protein
VGGVVGADGVEVFLPGRLASAAAVAALVFDADAAESCSHALLK